MKLFYHKDPVGNFGDDLNPWLWPRLAPELFGGATGMDDDETLFVGIGSILDHRIPDLPDKVIFGTGIGYGRLPAMDEKWSICCVRGPRTARALRLPSNLAITDPAVLVSTQVPPPPPERRGISFIPHHRSKIRASEAGVDLAAVCSDAGLRYIDPAWEVDRVIDEIRLSERVVAEAMHGAIVADALRVPWTAVQLFGHILPLKWSDWSESLGMRYHPALYSGIPHSALPTPHSSLKESLASFLSRVVASGEASLSGERSLASALERLQEKLYLLRRAQHAHRCYRVGADYSPDPEALRAVPWLYEIQSAIEELDRLIERGKRFILVDDCQWGGGKMLAGREAVPFLERAGEYWGPPPDSDTAVRELERLIAAGAHYIVFAWSSFWWLDHYAALRRHLHANYTLVLSTGRLVVFKLAPASPV